jgi:hypothetical protein
MRTAVAALGLGDAGALLAGILYLVGFAAAGGLYFRHKVASRRERLPVDFKVMRNAGETLRGKIAKRDDAFLTISLGYAMVPITALLVSSLAFFGLRRLASPEWVLWAGGVVGVGLTFFASKKAIRRVAVELWRRRSDVLGYMGERLVADCLAPVARSGFHVFHDVPASVGDRTFNLDHVVVGRSGVWVIETKARRKGRALPGRDDHKVIYDGQRLSWPWGEDRSGLDQVEANARWLQDFVQRLTGVSAEVNKIVALPGWWVEAVTKRHECRVLVMNPKKI